MIAECLAETGDDRSVQLAIDLAQRGRPVEAVAIEARWHARNNRWSEAADSVVAAFEGYRDDPWSHPPVIDRLFPLSSEIARQSFEGALKIFEAATQPFSVHMFDVKRRALLYDIGRLDGSGQLCTRALAQYEPLVPWDLEFLTSRWRCYENQNPRLADLALRDLDRFRSNRTLPLDWGLRQASQTRE
jgi:hypothetical protein